MNPETSHPFGPIKTRIALLQELAEELQGAQPALTRDEVEALERHTVRQNELCNALREQESARAFGSRSNPTSTRIEVQQEMLNLETRVRRLNRVYAALLRRATRSLVIMQRCLEGSAAVYSRPAIRDTGSQNSVRK